MLEQPVLTIDAIGRKCPVPIIMLAGRLREVPIGSVIAVTADDPAARTDIPAWCRMRGQEYVGEEAAPDGTPRYLVRRVSPRP